MRSHCTIRAFGAIYDWGCRAAFLFYIAHANFADVQKMASLSTGFSSSRTLPGQWNWLNNFTASSVILIAVVFGV